MLESRKKEFAVVLLGALVVASFLIYQKYFLQPHTATPLQEQEVKAGETVSSEQKIVTTYDDVYVSKHLSLTPSNIVWFTNYYRTKNGVKPLRMQDALNRSAHNKNADMFLYNYFDHARTIGKTRRDFSGFMDDQNYNFVKAGENLARGDFETSRDVVNAWMNSESHKRNILDPNYTEIGVSIDTGTMDDIRTTLFTQHFGFPQKNCPLVNSSARASIKALSDRIEQLGSDIRSQEITIGDASVQDPNYNEQVDEYNTMVNSYNNFVSQLQSMVNAYNEQVKKYDQCINQGR